VKNRNDDIDVLRGLGIISMILIHVTAWYRSDHSASFFWNSSQFAVQVFVFCSGYVFALKNLSSNTLLSVIGMLRRAFRLLIPYYAFLLVYLPVENLITHRSLTPPYILRSITLTGGPDFNWAVLLFLQMAILSPILAWLFRKHRTLFWIVSTVAFFSSVASLGMHVANYKLVMWLPWAVIALFSWYIAVRKTWVMPFMISSLLFLVSGAFIATMSASMLFFDNKYPPNIYYLSYGAIWILALMKIIPYIPINNGIRRLGSFIGKNSYELFFIHFLILTALRAGQVWFPWGLQFLVVTSGSLALLSVLKKLTATRH